jgi:hypothetical protein
MGKQRGFNRANKAFNAIIERLERVSSIEDRIKVAENICKPRFVSQPERILDAFRDVTTKKHAFRVISMLMKQMELTESRDISLSDPRSYEWPDRRASKILVCRESSFQNGALMTIVDVMNSTDRTWRELPSRLLFIKALKHSGMKSVAECSGIAMLGILNYDYMADPKYRLYRWKYNGPKGLMDFSPQCFNNKLTNELEECQTMEAVIDCLQTTDIDFNRFIRPYCYFDIYRFDRDHPLLYYDVTFQEAFAIAQIFKKRLGVIAISRMSTCQLGWYITTMDELDRACEKDHTRTPSLCTFRSAFRLAGFKRAKECDVVVLHQLHSAPVVVDYPAIKAKYSCMRGLVAEYFYQPLLIQQWIECGKDILDYHAEQD